MNLVFAYVLITSALIAGTPRALTPEEVAVARDSSLAVAAVLPGAPAERAGLMPGDSILEASDGAHTWHANDPKSFSAFIDASGGTAIQLSVSRDGRAQTITATPATGVVASDPARYAIGVEVATIGVVPLSVSEALMQGVSLTWSATVLTTESLWHFFYGIFTFSANLSQVSGPIAIAGIVGAASAQGIGNLLSITAIISINLALINLIPVPALDGGRLLFVIIESVTRRPIRPEVARVMNALGFLFLIVLMVVVSIHDIFRIVS